MGHEYGYLFFSDIEFVNESNERMVCYAIFSR